MHPKTNLQLEFLDNITVYQAHHYKSDAFEVDKG